MTREFSGRNGSTEDKETVTVDAELIPEELKDRDQWLMWDASSDSPRRPHWRGEFSVGWNNPDDWHSFEEAAGAAAERDSWGIGYVFARSNEDYARGLYGALDLDGCVDEDGRPKDWLPSLQPFFDENANMEISPSGGGIHIPLVGFEPPEWWSNVFLSDDEHEGIEAYGSKFFTFTGDRLRNCGDTVADDGDYVEEWLIDAHTAIESELPPPLQDDENEDDEPDKSRDEIEDLETTDSIEDIYAAIDHLTEVDLSLSSSKTENENGDWESWDPGYRSSESGKSLKRYKDSGLFLDFGETSPKNCTWFGIFDIFAAEQGIITRPWDGLDGESWWDAVERARSKGAPIPELDDSSPSPPSPAKNGASSPQLAEAGPEKGDAPTSDLRDAEADPEEENWAAVRHWYEEEGKGTGRYCAANKLEERSSWMFVLESETLWVYDEATGYFSSWGEAYVSKVLEAELGAWYSSTEVTEIVERLAARNQAHRESLNAGAQDGNYLCVGNGVVDLETGELHDHDPAYKFTRGLKWDYDPERADPAPIREFLDDITKREADRDTLLDHLAHGLMPGHPYRSFVMMYGPGANGKTQLGQIFRGFVGEDNAASVELQDLTGDDAFATGGLPGAFVNVGDDISVSEIRDVSILKSLTGSGTIRANEKYEKQYEFENEAAMFFSANEPPRIAEESAAVGDRLYPIEMPYRFVKDPSGQREKQKVPGISKDILANEEAMRGLLMLCVEHAQRLIASNGEYSMPESPSERRDMYEAASDPIRRFALEHLADGEQGDAILKDDAFAVYREMCERQCERVASADGFKRQITQQSIVDVESARTRTLSPGEGLDACWRFVSFDGGAKEIMPDRLVARYFDESCSDADDDGEDNIDAGDSNGFDATPIETAAESLTGYVTITAEVVTTRRLGDDERGVKAILRDETGAIDVVSWDETFADRLEAMEEQHIALSNAEVSEYNGSRQLSVVEGLTGIQQIQQGVGYTQPPESTSQSLEAAATDGESATADEPAGTRGDLIKDEYESGDAELVDPRPQIVMFVRKQQDADDVHKDTIVDEFDDRMNEDKVVDVIRQLCQIGRLVSPREHYYRA